MTIVYLEVKPHKLSNRELAKVFETLKRQGQVTNEEDRKLNTQLGKAYYVRTNHRYVTIRILQSKLEAFVERTKIDDADIKTVRGGISRDLTALEQQLEEDEAAPNYVYPSLALIPTGNVNQSILQTIQQMDSLPHNLEENTTKPVNMNVTLSTMYDPDEEATDLSNISMIPGEENQHSIKEEPQAEQQVPTKTVPVLINTVETNSSQFKLDAGLSIPVWQKGTDQHEDVQFTRMYIRDLQRLKTLGVLKNEALLINASLVKSGRTNLFEEMPLEAETSVDALAKYLRKAYGMSRFDMMKEVQNVKQGPSENSHSFLSRVITLYYEAKGKTKKTIEEIKQNEDETFEIVGLFWRGLFDQRVRVTLKQRMDGLNIEDLADVTKNIQSSYEEMKEDSAVNLIDANTEGPTSETNVLNINSRLNFHRKSSSPRYKIENSAHKGFQRNRNCWSCGKPGHFARNCWHNPKNQNQDEERSSEDQ